MVLLTHSQQIKHVVAKLIKVCKTQCLLSHFKVTPTNVVRFLKIEVSYTGVPMYSPSSRLKLVLLCVFSRSHKLGRDVTLCLKRRRRRGGRGGQRQR